MKALKTPVLREDIHRFVGSRCKPHTRAALKKALRQQERARLKCFVQKEVAIEQMEALTDRTFKMHAHQRQALKALDAFMGRVHSWADTQMVFPSGNSGAVEDVEPNMGHENRAPVYRMANGNQVVIASCAMD